MARKPHGPEYLSNAIETYYQYNPDREYLARVKVFVDLLTGKQPKVLMDEDVAGMTNEKFGNL